VKAFLQIRNCLRRRINNDNEQQTKVCAEIFVWNIVKEPNKKTIPVPKMDNNKKYFQRWTPVRETSEMRSFTIQKPFAHDINAQMLFSLLMITTNLFLDIKYHALSTSSMLSHNSY